MTITNLWLWIGFSLFVLFALSLDSFFLTHRISHPYQSFRAAIYWTLTWIVCALVFNIFLWVYLDLTQTREIALRKSLEFLTGYLIEKSLSIDNLFAFYMIFQEMHISKRFQQRVFTYGIFSAVILRLIIILMGVWLVVRFHWMLMVMGIFLLLTGIKMVLIKEKKNKKLTHSPFFKFLKKYLRVTDEIKSEHFFIRKNKLWYATPLFIALIFIELSDIIFAFDSIPAIFAITQDPFIVWTSNIFAILGLRALYFVLANMVTQLHMIRYGVAFILIFVGGKIIINPWWQIPVGLSLFVIASMLILFSVLSLIFQRNKKEKNAPY